MATIKDLYIGAMMVDASQKLKLPYFFSLFQDIACENAEEIGCGKKVITDRGYDWVIMRVKAEFYEPIMFGDTHELYTYPYLFKNSFIFVRNAGIKSKQNKTLAKLTSMWALMDHKTRKIQVRPDVPYASEYFGDDPLPLPNKLKEEEVTRLYSRQMRYSDCDINGHVNNTRYIEMICDVFDLEFYMHHYFKSVELNYMFELKDGDLVDVWVSSDKTYIECRVEDKTMFSAKLEFEEVK